MSRRLGQAADLWHGVPPFRAHLAAFLVVGLVGLSCGAPATCQEIRFSPQARRDFVKLDEEGPSAWVPPCAFDPALEVTSVFVDMLPSARPQPRMNFVVTRSGEPAFTFSQTTAEAPFTQIPQGTHRLRTQTGSTVAEGFAGPSGNGPDIAYVRWRVEPLTFEVLATVSPRQTEGDIVQLVRGLMEGGE